MRPTADVQLAETPSVPFECLTFVISKPGWGTSSLVIAPASPMDLVASTASSLPSAPDASGNAASLREVGYELRLKHIRDGAATSSEVKMCSLEAACSLDRWIRTLRFYDGDATDDDIVPHAGTWSLKIACDPSVGSGLARGGTSYPESFPDLLTTMIGLGLPGFQHMSVERFLADFATSDETERSPVGNSAHSDMPAGLDALGLPAGLDASDLQEALGELMKDPGRAEGALRQQFKDVPLSTKQQILEFVRVSDPGHYEWWRRILLG